MQFLDHAAMFPLFALGLYRLVNGGRGWLYAVGLFLLATSCTALSWPWWSGGCLRGPIRCR